LEKYNDRPGPRDKFFQEKNMKKKVLTLVVMSMLFSFNCEKGCGKAKSGEAQEQTMEQPAEDVTGAETPATEAK